MSVLSDLGVCYRWVQAKPGRLVCIEQELPTPGATQVPMWAVRLVEDGEHPRSWVTESSQSSLAMAGAWARESMAQAKAKRRAK